MRSIGSSKNNAAGETKERATWLNPTLALAVLFAAIGWFNARSEPVADRRYDGFNLIVAPGHPFGSPSADLALGNAKALGAKSVAIIPFFWQADRQSPDLVRGSDMGDDELRAAIRKAHAAGLTVLVKPHVWVPASWAGAIDMRSGTDWQQWFGNYQRELTRIAHVAEEEKAEALAIGTELAQSTKQPQWELLIATTRTIFSGRLLYVAHNLEEAETVPFWERLDAIGVSLYPTLGEDGDQELRRTIMRSVADRLDMLALIDRKPIVVGEIGLRSAQGAAAKPWESAEERKSDPDPALQADVLADWLAILNRPSVSGVMIWRWFTDPDAGGIADTDFTVQGKPAQHVLMCAWTLSCRRG
jgi:hypothetical protein